MARPADIRSGQRPAGKECRLDPRPQAPVAAAGRSAGPGPTGMARPAAARRARSASDAPRGRSCRAIARPSCRRKLASNAGATSSGSRSSQSPRPVRRRVQRPGFAVSPPRLARIARGPGERAIRDGPPPRQRPRGAAKAASDRPARRHPHPTQAQEQGHGTGLRQPSPAAPTACGAGTASDHGGEWPVPAAILAHKASSRRSHEPNRRRSGSPCTGRSASSAFTGAFIDGTPTMHRRPAEPATPGQSATMPRLRQASTAAVNAGCAGARYWAP